MKTLNYFTIIFVSSSLHLLKLYTHNINPIVTHDVYEHAQVDDWIDKVKEFMLDVIETDSIITQTIIFRVLFKSNLK